VQTWYLANGYWYGGTVRSVTNEIGFFAPHVNGYCYFP
jgi:hypothetical protein